MLPSLPLVWLVPRLFYASGYRATVDGHRVCPLESRELSVAACIRILIHPVKMYVYLPAHCPHRRKGKPSGGQDHRSQSSWGAEMPRVSCPGSGSLEMCSLTEQESVLNVGLGAWRMPGRPPVAISESGKCSHLYHHFPELGRSCIS